MQAQIDMGPNYLDLDLGPEPPETGSSNKAKSRPRPASRPYQPEPRSNKKVCVIIGGAVACLPA